MTDHGPSIVNLRLDGILPEDISTSRTKQLASAILSNINFDNEIVCNEGDNFTHATLFLIFTNTSDKPLKLDARFFHNNQFRISRPALNITLDPGSDQRVEVQLEAVTPMDYNEIEPLQLEWLFHYDLPEYPDFKLNGLRKFVIVPQKKAVMQIQ